MRWMSFMRSTWLYVPLSPLSKPREFMTATSFAFTLASGAKWGYGAPRGKSFGTYFPVAASKSLVMSLASVSYCTCDASPRDHPPQDIRGTRSTHALHAWIGRYMGR